MRSMAFYYDFAAFVAQFFLPLKCYLRFIGFTWHVVMTAAISLLIYEQKKKKLFLEVLKTHKKVLLIIKFNVFPPFLFYFSCSNLWIYHLIRLNYSRTMTMKRSGISFVIRKWFMQKIRHHIISLNSAHISTQKHHEVIE